jgi:hypothetical protein
MVLRLSLSTFSAASELYPARFRISNRSICEQRGTHKKRDEFRYAFLDAFFRFFCYLGVVWEGGFHNTSHVGDLYIEEVAVSIMYQLRVFAWLIARKPRSVDMLFSSVLSVHVPTRSGPG